MKKGLELIKKKRKKLILWWLLLVLFVILIQEVRFELSYRKMMKNQVEEAASEKEEIDRIISRYQDDIEVTKEKYAEDISAKTCVLLFFENFEESAYKDIITEMDRYGYHGVIVFRDGKYPGAPGAISVELYQQLLEKGWEGAIGNSSDITIYENLPEVRRAAWRQYIEEMKGGFSGNGLPEPTIYVPHTNEKISQISDMMEECGMTLSTTLYTNGTQAATEMATGITDIGLIVGKYKYEELASDLSNLVPQAKSMGLLFREVEYGAPINTTHTSIYMFKQQLQSLYNMSSIVKVTTYSEFNAYQEELIKRHKLEHTKFIGEIYQLNRKINMLKLKNRKNFEKIFS